MSELEKAVEQLIAEGYVSEDIKDALQKILQEARDQPTMTGNLDDYLDSLEDEEEDDELL